VEKESKRIPTKGIKIKTKTKQKTKTKNKKLLQNPKEGKKGEMKIKQTKQK
jgi:hypothetical protein